MEVCLIGLFFLVRDQYNRVACQWQAVIMIIVFGFTILYQWLLNKEFSPLLMYLPVSLEDDACRREEEFFEKRQPLLARTNTSDADASNVVAKPKADTKRRISWAERVNTNTTARSHFFNRSNGDLLFTNTFAEGAVPSTSPTYANFGYDLESQSRTHDSETPGIRANAIGQSLFEGIYTELADLTADERDRLVQRAFQHEALRTKRPVIWIPRDDLGVSDDEIYRTQRFSKHIWISNEYQALDGKCRTIFSRSPPDFSEVDLIQL
ncbi:hypothetical protein KEM55_000497 [Ascosphaera atra]|nr:hypothetical protein KEM55_000497 [Ascosphaera atra]